MFQPSRKQNDEINVILKQIGVSHNFDWHQSEAGSRYYASHYSVEVAKFEVGFELLPINQQNFGPVKYKFTAEKIGTGLVQGIVRFSDHRCTRLSSFTESEWIDTLPGRVGVGTHLNQSRSEDILASFVWKDGSFQEEDGKSFELIKNSPTYTGRSSRRSIPDEVRWGRMLGSVEELIGVDR